MKRKLIAALLALSLFFVLTPRVSSVGSVYFVGINSTLLPLSDSTMPMSIGAQIYVPYEVFENVSIHGTGSVEVQTLRMYRAARQVDFYVSTGTTVGMDNHVYEDVTARIIGSVFYVPLDFVCTFFGLRYSIINCEPAPVVRIKSTDESQMLNDNSFPGYHAEQMRSSYNEYFSIPEPVTPPSQGVDGNTEPPPPSSPSPPSYDDVTIYLSFNSIVSGYAETVLDALPPGYRCCFFLTEADILQNPGLIRRIAGSGHAIGLWLIDGSYAEYLNISTLLFEAVKMKTLLVSSDNVEDASRMSSENGLVFWPVSRAYGEDAEPDSTALKLPTASGSRHHLLFSCTENAAALLTDILGILRQGAYSVARITETVTPVK